MRRIVLDMPSNLFAEAIARSLAESEPDFVVRRAESPGQTAMLCRSCAAFALILEVTRQSPWTLEERLALGREVKSRTPECKTVLLVDEIADSALAAAVTQAKKDGLADVFVYSSVSPAYFAAVLDTL